MNARMSKRCYRRLSRSEPERTGVEDTVVFVRNRWRKNALFSMKKVP